MPIDVSVITDDQLKKIYSKRETHFCDLKSKEIQPRKLTKTLTAFANADGGELYIGIDEREEGAFVWNGFTSLEDANGHLQALEESCPLGTHVRYSFLRCDGQPGAVLFCEIEKTPDIRIASDGKVYLRRGAQNLPQDTDEKLQRLKFSKGIMSFEDQILNTDPTTISNSIATIEFSFEVIPTAEPDFWLRKQKLIVSEKPTVAGVILFADEPQVDLPKSAIKIYRYKTAAPEGTRDNLAFDPISIEGNAYQQIYKAVREIKRIIEEIPIIGESGLESIEYPTEAIHEIVTNAVIHRDYSINDDIHVRIFDNRIEVSSPGTLPAYVTVKNILVERFARNPKIVRLLNKFKNPPNKDVGEGLNTAFDAMKKLKLKDPVIEQRDNYVMISLKHEKLGTPEQIIVEYLRTNKQISTSVARKICVTSQSAVQRAFKKLTINGLIERSDDKEHLSYVKGPKFPQ